MRDIKSSNYKKNQWDATIQDISTITPGLSRALTEFEYILKPVKSDSIKILAETKKQRPLEINISMGRRKLHDKDKDI